MVQAGKAQVRSGNGTCVHATKTLNGPLWRYVICRYGGYDHGRQAGVLHVADHHVIPGKKQWVWGCGDFGKAWDRNLTDADGPYAELKDLITGHLAIEAASLDVATELARQCPIFLFDGSVEVRPVLEN